MPAKTYAQGTDVPVQRSVSELDRLVTKYGATGFAYARDDQVRRVMFRIDNRLIQFTVHTPDQAEFAKTPTGRYRDQSARETFAATEELRRWRSIVLVVKALLVGVEDKVVSLSDAFLPYTVLPGGATVGEWAAPQLDAAYAHESMPELMPGGAR